MKKRSFKGEGTDDLLHSGAWFVADMFKSLMNEVVIPAVEGALGEKRESRREEEARQARPGEVVGVEGFDDGGSGAMRYGIYAGGDSGARRHGVYADGGSGAMRYGIYAGGDTILTIVSEAGSAGRIGSVPLEIFIGDGDRYFAVDMELIREGIETGDEEFSAIEGEGIELEFVDDDTAFKRASDIAGSETLECDHIATFAMALWCKTGNGRREAAALIEKLAREHRIELERPIGKVDVDDVNTDTARDEEEE